jgi:hypothetical protein
VRVHTDAHAARAADGLQARAVTVGDDIAFAPGEYQPGTADGRRLLAHEFAHVAQQRSGGPRLQCKLRVGAGTALDTKGFTTTKAGDVYTCPKVVKNSIWNELFTSLLASPRTFTLAGSTNATVNANLDTHMETRKSIVDFAAKKKYTFAAGAAFRMNPAYWVVGATSYDVKPGVDRREAIQDLNVNPGQYAIACQAATALTMESGGSPLTNDFGASDDDWIPGDWGYITNTKFPAGGPDGQEGENLIYTGKDKFWGHFGPGIEYKTLTAWRDQVKSWHGGARIESHRARPNIGLV